jgi:hypothetical protein
MKLMALATLAGLTLGCAPKKLVQPIQGPATARYRLSDCKALPNGEPGIECSHVQMRPVILPVK